MNDWFMWFIVFWTIFLITVMFIGGYFMFRKFLKRLPKDDGKSILDWQEYYIDKTLHLWEEDKKQLLNELVEPVPDLFRDVAKGKIAGRISELAYNEGAKKLTLEHMIRGYILATPKRDHKFLRKKLNELKIDVDPFEYLFEEVKS
ncbi:DUF2621 domain-containing protein [Alkalihalobacillus pseudalcaliphilus]|uniref:DUF2621 domain-containing protein n=1 Tax=Alkalihalobacillus pseudalcaliphilus TaxID=79884 RepID=UPI00064D84E0|nr:DUF2621 domain-containing protein [Alkalihalobacillus pseudalcaliphilus]KMK76586.1 hypothetical protein AB990_15585 [Alkalihalobacillus pseudalcaliphilus]